jgi:hypothetical protein
MPYVKDSDASYKRLSIKPLHIRNGKTLFFPSIITEFTDSWTPRWTPTNVYGRMDPLSAYSGTSRELVLGFRVISDNKSEASANMASIQSLLQYQYPTYHNIDGSKILAAPPYFKIKFMNIVGGGKFLQGYVNSAIQVNPGFQSKDQPQYFSKDWSKLYFSDVNIVLRMQILHEGMVGRTTTGRFRPSSKYPYGVTATGNPSLAAPPQTITNGSISPSQNSLSNQSQTSTNSEVAPNSITPPMNEAENDSNIYADALAKVSEGVIENFGAAMFQAAEFLGGIDWTTGGGTDEEEEDPSQGAEHPGAGNVGTHFGPTHVDK